MPGAVVAEQCRTDTALTSCYSGGGPRQPRSSGLAPVSRFHSSVPLFTLVPTLTGLLASVDVKQQKLKLTKCDSHAQPCAAENPGNDVTLLCKTAVVPISPPTWQRPNELSRRKNAVICMYTTRTGDSSSGTLDLGIIMYYKLSIYD